jgi:hypothetical protein
MQSIMGKKHVLFGLEIYFPRGLYCQNIAAKVLLEGTVIILFSGNKIPVKPWR